MLNPYWISSTSNLANLRDLVQPVQKYRQCPNLCDFKIPNKVNCESRNQSQIILQSLTFIFYVTLLSVARLYKMLRLQVRNVFVSSLGVNKECQQRIFHTKWMILLRFTSFSNIRILMVDSNRLQYWYSMLDFNVYPQYMSTLAYCKPLQYIGYAALQALRVLFALRVP